ncbi:bifunctional diaminohydroxyphosphoribosylaminopyrimidine deaminase/5-amino-6-(5-phosphoribosylamino)uracil reductase RibD [Sandaracinobacteroides saxicola]|uniref:Riboflavin biosynthesis protein RibD n=1 Tax=Sandaracinobacteroides saxicola TaxID=2759707 RepID=A0A7G5IG22_9SPHN|nr:bifunctional diaminohydroxyphosphoribosylaminopyrimidine deaminase/5-amino-6-(5-phosphoribosylamino)uracil reductase RibD [Sandaracinobacteroides saxicola]QMW22314.1 bifunctional diaminohydroxyphosphoribosylaminopyrimidine deaminase/5-amino-6-(5-phosphoribosylamino)uracil reductase RibD [Sandaracinobacteroides saxicola]
MTDARWMAAALALATRGRGSSAPNPNVGCIVTAGGHVIGRGWTQPGGRPHAEAMALAQAGAAARGATAHVTLEPCAHASPRGPACADGLIAAGLARVVVAMTDPDPRTAGQGIARLRAAGIDVAEGVGEQAARTELAGFIRRMAGQGPEVTLKLALSLDGRLALPDGRSRWITGEVARAHSHLERAAADAIIVGHGTWATDAPALDVRLPGWSGRQPARAVLGSTAIDGILTLSSLAELDDHGWQRVLVEGGGATAGALLAADRVDRLLLYCAPILIGDGRSLAGLALPDLAAAHGRWRLTDRRPLGSDSLEEYRRNR